MTLNFTTRDTGRMEGVQAPEQGPRMTVTIETEWVRGDFIEVQRSRVVQLTTEAGSSR